MTLLRTLARLLAFAALIATPCRALDATPLTIAGKDRSHVFHIDVAATRAEKERGLMHRATLPDDYGMLFLFDREQPVVMWMKDTPHSLDMLFIDEKGKIVGIAADTTPFSESLIPSPGLARAVLEVAGGTSERLRILTGDRVSHPRLPTAKE